jgi:hypothetical protein
LAFIVSLLGFIIVLVIGAVADIVVRTCRLAQMLNKSTILVLMTLPDNARNARYAEDFTLDCVLPFLKYSKISSFNILANFSLNLSLC